MKTWPMNDTASSPFWFCPLMRNVTIPHPGRDRLTRFSVTSLKKVIVSPA
jgi:hypothetical protein